MKNIKEPIVLNRVREYDPSKQYTWDPNAKFEITGAQFGLWLNTVRGTLGSKEAVEIRMAMECNEAIEAIMVHSVSSGVVKEVPSKEE